LGIRVILVKSFARIHETNLKKQGMLGLTFSNEADYDLIREDDTIDIVDLTQFSPDRQLTLVLNHNDGTKDSIKVNHTYNAGQILWFKAGSALNLMAKQIAASEGFKQPMKNSRPQRNAKKMSNSKSGKAKISKPAAKKVATKTLAKQAVKQMQPGKKTKKGLVKKAVNKIVKLVKRVVSKKKVAPKKGAGVVKRKIIVVKKKKR